MLECGASASDAGGVETLYHEEGARNDDTRSAASFHSRLRLQPALFNCNLELHLSVCIDTTQFIRDSSAHISRDIFRGNLDLPPLDRTAGPGACIKTDY